MIGRCLIIILNIFLANQVMAVGLSSADRICEEELQLFHHAIASIAAHGYCLSTTAANTCSSFLHQNQSFSGKRKTVKRTPDWLRDLRKLARVSLKHSELLSKAQAIDRLIHSEFNKRLNGYGRGAINMKRFNQQTVGDTTIRELSHRGADVGKQITRLRKVLSRMPKGYIVLSRGIAIAENLIRLAGSRFALALSLIIPSTAAKATMEDHFQSLESLDGFLALPPKDQCEYLASGVRNSYLQAVRELEKYRELMTPTILYQECTEMGARAVVESKSGFKYLVNIDHFSEPDYFAENDSCFSLHPLSYELESYNFRKMTGKKMDVLMARPGLWINSSFDKLDLSTEPSKHCRKKSSKARKKNFSGDRKEKLLVEGKIILSQLQAQCEVPKNQVEEGKNQIEVGGDK